MCNFDLTGCKMRCAWVDFYMPVCRFLKSHLRIKLTESTLRFFVILSSIYFSVQVRKKTQVCS